ncbi:MMS19 nucleotide excision repair protein [Daphnia magna]|uniref:MMS19 nucleotide excision repair protein n=1 Tax=Daphnia magna TaxID=35525 RepID=A0A164U9J5_9CRUS|nr:MMS19 nucleotide excision repair protein [Daphnia magna]
MVTPTSIQKLRDSLVLQESMSEAISIVSQSIASREITILQLVENLQPELLHQQAAYRCRAVSTIASILEQLAPDLKEINEKEIDLITEFFCSKLKDHHSILPAALHGLHVLSSTNRLSPGLARSISQAIFQDVHCQSQLQHDRRAIYKTIKNLLALHIRELQILGQDFVFGLIQAADQERDPRNLLILFSIFPVVARYFRLEPFTEEFFEVFSCYFPIDFTPPANDPYGVTKDQLCEGLRQCLASSAHFAEYCMPLLQEKLESDLVSAKVEALKTLELCCLSYHPTQLEKWIDTFWKCIRREVLINVNTEELEHASLDALAALSRAFAANEEFKNPAFTKLLKEILSECQGHLCEPERRLMTPSSYVLLAICSGNAPACALIVSQVIPLLMDQYRIRSQSAPRQFILNCLNKLVQAGLYGFTEIDVAQSGICPLIPTLLELYLEVLKEDDALLCGLSLQGLGHFVGIGLNHQDLEKVNQSLLGLLQQPLTTGHTVEEIGRYFYKCAEQNESWFVEQVLVKLLDMAVSDKANVIFLLLRNLPPLPRIRAQVLSQLLARLEQSGPELRLEMLKTLAYFAQHDELQMFHQLHSWALKTLKEGDPPTSLEATCGVLRKLASSLSSEDATQFIDEQIGRYIDQHLASSAWVVPIMEATLGSLDATPVGQNLEKLIKTLEPLTICHPNADVRISACRLVAALINKVPEGHELESILDSLRTKWQDPSADRNKTACLFVWITKALLMRSYSKLDQSIQELVEFLNDPTHGYLVAEGFKIILGETEECLNFDSHANIRLMYRQRFFQEVVPRLLKLYRESPSCNKSACFAAIANQLAFIPEGVLVAHITTLIPLLIQCLNIEQPDQLIISTITAFMGLMSDNVNAIEEYISSLVPRLLTLAKDGLTMDVRRLALRCLSELRKAQTVVLLPLRSEVILRLIPCLDDKKRLVRREAAVARQKWAMLGQAGCD